MKKKVQPRSSHLVKTLIYSQEDVVKALGIVIPAGTPAWVRCDGTNQVSVEIWQKAEP